jgi:hypothetical protein
MGNALAIGWHYARPVARFVMWATVAAIGLTIIVFAAGTLGFLFVLLTL